ncbi:hypothetical protein [Salinispora arenicola]|nr:hypothetical protein [Salinispora arenicola]
MMRREAAEGGSADGAPRLSGDSPAVHVGTLLHRAPTLGELRGDAA